MYYLIQTYREDNTWGYDIFGDQTGELRVVPISNLHESNRIAFERKTANGRWYTMYTNRGHVIREYRDQLSAGAECERLNTIHKVMAS